MLTVLLLGSLPQPAHSQTFAMAPQQQNRRPADAAAQPQNGKRLKDVLNELSQQFSVNILFEERIVQNITVSPTQAMTGKRLDRQLTALLNPLGLTYKKTGDTQYVVFQKKSQPVDHTLQGAIPGLAPGQLMNLSPTSIDKSAPSFAGRLVSLVADQTVSGKVSDEKGEGLPGVSVVLKGTTKGTTTDVDGGFRLSVPETANVVLIFSFVGYISQEVAVGNRSVIDVKLVSDDKTLSEVVVVGYGVQKKSDLTGAVAQVTGDELQKVAPTNVQNALQGQAAGVYVSQSSGAPGAGADIIIRGQTSVTGLNQVLYVVDGIPITGNLNSINPQDIQSIEVLKDASAAAIYGSRASSGVVLITTKRGKSKQTKLSFDAFYGSQQMSRKIDLMNGQEWAQTTEKGVSNALQRNPTASAFHNPDVWDVTAKQVRPNLVDSTDWQNAYYRAAPTQNYYLSFAGGNENSNVYVGVGYQRQDGIAPNSFFERYTTRLNSDHKLLNSRLRIGNNLSLSYNRQRGVSENNDYVGGVGSVLRMSPLVAVYKKPGTYTQETDRFAGVTNTLYYGDIGNPLREAYLNTAQNNTYNVIGSLFADIEVVKGLTFHSEFGGELVVDNNKSFGLAFQEYVEFRNFSNLNRSNNMSYQLQARNFLTLKKTVGKHDLTVLAGTDGQNYHTEGFSAGRIGFPSQDNPNLWYLNIGSPLTATNGDNASEWAILSYYGRVNYSFSDKYLFTATLRRDGSSRFFGKNRWGNFPSFSAGWRITEEAFMKGIPFISNLKLRAGWGLLGNERSAGNYVTASNIERGIVDGLDIGYIFGPGLTQTYYTGARPQRIPNLDLTWEISDQSNVGIDAGFFNNRITLSADYFIKKTRRMILDEPLPVAGRGTLAAPSINIGTLQNTGLELEASYAKRTGDFTFNVGLNLTTTRGNKITKLANGVLYLDSEAYRGAQAGTPNRSLVGQSIGLFYGYDVMGIFKSQEDLTANPKQAGAAIGDYIYRDINGDKVIDANDRTFIGNPWPLFVGGLKSSFGYKNFDLNVFFQGSYGNDILNLNDWFLLNTGPGEPYNMRRDYLDYFDPVTNPNGVYAAPNVLDPANNRRISSKYVEDGSYLRLQNLQLGFKLPDPVLKRLHASNLRVYVSSQNLFTLSNYSGYNPDLGVRSTLQKGLDRTVYPLARTFLVGLNLSL